MVKETEMLLKITDILIKILVWGGIVLVVAVLLLVRLLITAAFCAGYLVCLIGYVVAVPFIEAYKKLVWWLRKRD